MTAVALINPFFAARLRRQPRLASARDASARFEKRVIGDATLYRADCFDVLPTLSRRDTRMCFSCSFPWG